MSSLPVRGLVFVLTIGLFKETFGGRPDVDNGVDGCWVKNRIPYTLDNRFSFNQKTHIRSRVLDMNRLTCVKWEEKKAEEFPPKYVEFEYVADRICHTTDELMDCYEYPFIKILVSDRCFIQNEVLPLMMRAMGFHNEQQRWDRDCYVNVNYDAARPNIWGYTKIETPWLERFPYDYNSIMHAKRSEIIRRKNEDLGEFPLGNQKGELTKYDIWKIQFKFCGSPHYCTAHPEECQKKKDYEKIYCSN